MTELSPIYDKIKELHQTELQMQKNSLLDEFEKRLKQPIYGKAVKDSLQFIQTIRRTDGQQGNSSRF